MLHVVLALIPMGRSWLPSPWHVVLAYPHHTYLITFRWDRYVVSHAPAWQVGHQKRFRPPTTRVRTSVPHTQHGMP